MKNDNPLLNATLKIDWQIDQYFETIDYHTKSVSLIGYNGFGQKYTAMALEVCGEIENIEDIEKDNTQPILVERKLFSNTDSKKLERFDKLNTNWETT